MSENDDLKKEPNRETEAALEAAANRDVVRFADVGSLLADMADEVNMTYLLIQARHRAAILHASSAWGSDGDAALIEALVKRVEELESWKAAEDAHHHMLKRRIAELEAAIREITGT